MTKKRILMSGNEAFADGAIEAGCRFYAGYPITPQNEFTAYMAEHMPKASGVFIQAESELAAINMVFGAAAAGERAMTSSSSPGISLKQEGISYLAGAELPAVIVNVMRGGPGLGNIAPSQSDYFQATRGGGHGDYHCIVLAPASVGEAREIMSVGFDLADAYRTPVIILGDGMLGQMREAVVVDGRHKTVERQKYIQSWALTGCKQRAPHVIKSIYLAEGGLEKFNLHLQDKYGRIQKKEQRYEYSGHADARVVVVAYGTMARIVKGALDNPALAKKKVGLLRPISLWPFPVDALQRIVRKNKVKEFLAIEMSYGQMIDDVALAVNGKVPVGFIGRAGGGVPSEEAIISQIRRLLA
jgi:2-oxoglutarate/2-oxoacid ferredoxin oxidoreductase subunit alpha